MVTIIFKFMNAAWIESEHLTEKDMGLLIDKDLIHRETNTRDTRNYQLYTTETGKKLIERGWVASRCHSVNALPGVGYDYCNLIAHCTS